MVVSATPTPCRLPTEVSAPAVTVKVASRAPTADGKKRYTRRHPPAAGVVLIVQVVPLCGTSVEPVQVSSTRRKSWGAPVSAADTGPREAEVLQLLTVRVTTPAAASLTTTVPKSGLVGLMVSTPVEVPVRLRLAEPPLPPATARVAVLASLAVPCGMNWTESQHCCATFDTSWLTLLQSSTLPLLAMRKLFGVCGSVRVAVMRFMKSAAVELLIVTRNHFTFAGLQFAPRET